MRFARRFLSLIPNRSPTSRADSPWKNFNTMSPRDCAARRPIASLSSSSAASHGSTAGGIEALR